MPSSFQWNSLTNKKKNPSILRKIHSCPTRMQMHPGFTASEWWSAHESNMHRSNQPRIRCEKNKNKKIETKWKRNKSTSKINNGAAGQKVNMVDFVSEMMPPIPTIHDATPYSSIAIRAASISCVDHCSGSVCVWQFASRTRTHTQRPYGLCVIHIS